MLGWAILVLAAIGLAIWLSNEVRREEKMSDPRGRTDTGYQSSRFEQNAYNRVYASEISRKRNQPKNKKKKSQK